MNKQEQQAFFDIFTQEQRDLFSAKGDDYAGEDRLSNFKFAGAICGLSAERQCLSLVATKVARLGQLLSGKEPKNEAIKDSVLDLCNYGVLLAMLLAEK